ncbi:hypothetical protein [Maridesulfovibrio bastinii]|uniref:hypothetical protein n=1 Tax=Maridesulfovibrio bastinii TaxID=47157 RepID=UPI000402DE7D|nr:hypothetical protein [Maridesulfovibrio bastinii]
MANKSTVSVLGRSYDWESLTITGPQGVIVGISEINWKSNQKKKRTYGKGLLPRGATRSNYEATVDFTLDYSEYTDLLSALDSGIFNSVFNISLVFEPDGGDKREVVLKNIMIDDKDESAKQGDDEQTVKLSGTAEMININGTPEYEEK